MPSPSANSNYPLFGISQFELLLWDDFRMSQKSSLTWEDLLAVAEGGTLDVAQPMNLAAPGSKPKITHKVTVLFLLVRLVLK